MTFVAKHQIEIDEGERIPNRFTFGTLLGILITLLFACILNQVNVFEVDKITIWSFFGGALLFCVIASVLVLNNKTLVHPATKYVLMSMILILSFSVEVFLNISVVLLILLPMFLAARYHSYTISTMAIIGSVLSSVFAPILAWKLHAWSLNIMLGYLETTCHVSVVGFAEGTMPTQEVITNLLLYLSLPQVMVIAIFGVISIHVTKTSISGMQNHIKVMQLGDNLGLQLKRVEAMQDRILFSMADIIESRDNSTGGHVKRTREVVRLLVEAMHNDPEQHLTQSFCDAVVNAAPLHDIGKIAVDDAILRKAGPLSPAEREQINNHPTKGAELINSVLVDIENEEFVRIASNIALYHHERFDGEGYPQHLSGTQIPLEARIMAIADIYDALVSSRCYKAPLAPQEAFERIEALMGTQLDPQLNKYFISTHQAIEQFYQENLPQ